MARPIVKLSDFDPKQIVAYAVTEQDLTSIYQYTTYALRTNDQRAFLSDATCVLRWLRKS